MGRTLHWTAGPNRPRPHGFSLVELLVVIAILALLVSVAIPWLAQARRRALAVACASNLHQIVTGLVAYARNNDRLMLPCDAAGVANQDDLALLYPCYVTNIDAFRCPASPYDHPTKAEHIQWKTSRRSVYGDRAQLSYEYPGECVMTLTREVHQELALLAYDDDGRGTNKEVDEDSHAPDGGNMSYMNGAVEWVKAEDWKVRAWDGLYAWYDPPRRYKP